MTKAYEEIIDFIAAGTSPATVASFQASEAVKARVGDLLMLSKASDLSAEEKAELDIYIQLEQIMRLAKAKAREYMNA